MSSSNHSDRAHARLSASGSSRWLNCTASPTEEAKYPPQKSTSYAQEGTQAHEAAEALLYYYLEGKELPPMDPEMFRHAEFYRDYVLEVFNGAKEKDSTAIIAIEQRVDLTAFIPEGFGTCDCLIIADSVMHVIDYKYGKGIRVDAHKNSQLMLYAVGALRFYELAYDIKAVEMHVVQPRLDHISSWSIDADELMVWGNKTIKPKAEEAATGPGTHVPGEWCRWCSHKPRCRALATQATKMASAEFSELSDAEIIEYYENLKTFDIWAKALKDYVVDQAVNHDKEWEGYKLVESRSNRKITDQEMALKKLTDSGFDKDRVTNVKIKGIGDLTKIVGGDKQLNEILGTLIDKPKGAPTIVPLSDKRKPYTNSATEDFKNV